MRNMVFDEFKQSTSILEECYNKKMNPTQAQVWFDELKYYPLEKYKRAIRKICISNQYFPALSVVLDTLKTIRTEADLSKGKVECEACKGTGYVIYHKKINGLDYEYACQCNCENGVGLDYDGTKLADKEHRSFYYLPKATDVFGVGR